MTMQPRQFTASGIPVRTQLPRAANALVPVNLLPMELLLKIFSFVATSETRDEEDNDQQWQVTKRRCIEWLVLTKVCYHWYDVVRTTPDLWRVIDVYTKLEWLKLCLERSQAAPLAISFHNGDAAEEAEDLVIPQASRISHLSVLPGMDRSSLGWLHYLRKIPMPLLKELNIQGGPGFNVDRTCYPALG